MTTSKETRHDEWNAAYERGDNFVFYPHEEILRFLARNVRKRTGFNSFEDRIPDAAGMPLLDVGCGIGRHLVLAHDFGLQPYGFDLSDSAIALARKWLADKGISNPQERALAADIRALPWTDDFFGCAVSHGVLDSMPFAIACEGIREVARVMRPGAPFYCDLVAGDARDEIVETQHEQGTVQSYFDEARICELVGDSFTVEETVLVERHDKTRTATVARWHLTLRRMESS
jgi:SAM-dependent methyltransferase